MFTKESRL